MSVQEVIDYIHGVTNDKILRHFIGDLSDEEVEELAEEKENIYQDLVRKEKIWYVEGAEALLHELVEKELPFTIATASPKINIDFYFDYFNLGRWFKFEDIVYDDGTFPGKPDPMIYKKAATSLGLQPEECAVIKDEVAGVLSANSAGIGKVIIMSYSDKQRALFETSDLEYDAGTTDLNDFLGKHVVTN